MEKRNRTIFKGSVTLGLVRARKETIVLYKKQCARKSID
jgi:hypothetical protein